MMIDTYNDNLLSIREAFPDHELLDKKEAARYLGITEKTLDRRYPLIGGKISRSSLARCLAVRIEV